MDSNPPLPLPFTLPRWLTPARVAIAVAAAGGALVTLPLLVGFHDIRRELIRRSGAPIVIATTLLLSVFLLRRAINAASRERALAWCLFGGAILGLVNAGSSLAIMSLVQNGKIGEAVGLLLLGTLFGSIFGAPFGFVYGMAYAPLVDEAYRAKIAPSHDAIDRMLVRAGAWLAAVAGLARLLTSTALHRAPWSFDPTRDPSSAYTVEAALVELGAPHGGATYAALIAGLALFLAGASRIMARRRWLQKVAAGEVASWTIEPPTSEDDTRALLPLVHGAAAGGVLVHRAPAGSAPYRDHRPGVPLALTALPPS